MKSRIFLLSWMILSVHLSADCLVYSCDNTIRYAMQRYSNKTVNRLNDYKRTIDGSTKSETVYVRVLQEQNRELLKLLARVQIENISAKAISKENKRTKSLK